MSEKSGYEIALERIAEVKRTGGTELDLSELRLGSLPIELWQLTNLTSLDISSNGLTRLPTELWQLTNLTLLGIDGNGLTRLPAAIGQLTNLTKLYLANNRLSDLPVELWNLTQLTSLNLAGNNLRSLPSEIGQLTNLTWLSLWDNCLDNLPPEIGKLTNLTRLTLIETCLSSLPAEIGKLVNLTALDLGENGLNELPAEIGQLTNLTGLDLSGLGLTSLPIEIRQLTNLTWLLLGNNHLTSLPTEIGQLANLTNLDLTNNSLTSLPAEIGQLANLTNLDLTNNSLTSLPTEIGQLTNLTNLDLGGNPLISLPVEIWQLSNLTSFSIGGTPITSLPAEIAQLTNLTSLGIFRSALTNLPIEILQLTNLTKLELSFNELTDLPAGIAQLTKLTELNLYENKLTNLPDEIAQLTKLTVLDLGENQLTSLPAGILNLKNLEFLSLRENPIDLPAEILAKMEEPQVILNYLAQLWDEQRKSLRENKRMASGTSSLMRTTMNYSFFFDHLEYCQARGRGFSIFNADAQAIENFTDQCGQKEIPRIVARLSEKDTFLRNYSSITGLAVIIQDLPAPEFLQKAGEIADKLIYPLWFQRIPICFFSLAGRGDYPTSPVGDENLHRNYTGVVNALLHEQIFTLLERVNVQFAAPEFTNLASGKTIYTPIEEKFLLALEARQLAYRPQVRIGRFTVDFLVQAQGQEIIVECDGKAYHDPARDAERDKVLSAEGYPICRFSGSDIYADADLCVEKMLESLNHRLIPAYVLDTDLDESQQKAVESVNGPIRVLAPAGSGKTKTLINRVLHLLNQSIPAEKILALAFNKKASDEMQERLERKGVESVEVRTFHSLGYEIVHQALGWNFNGKGHQKATRDIMNAAVRQHVDLPAIRNKDPLDAFLDGLRRAKMELPPIETVTVEFAERIYPFEAIFNTYLEKQTAANHFDFDDMIYLAVRVLLKNPELRRACQSKYEFVLVDEFQDLNQAQILMLQILALPENNIFAVGDDDQMIYGFRGAEVRHIVQFHKRFSISASHVLNTNYRSSKMVVRHSGWLIQNNTDRIEKHIQSRPGAQPGRFQVSGHTTIFEQARFAADWLSSHKKENNMNWRDYAILYRYNAYQFPLAIMLDALQIPHSPLPGQQIFKTAVGRDIYSYLHVILSPTEATSPDFERILKRPNKYFTNQIIAQANNWKSFLHLRDLPNLRGWEQEKLADFVNRIERTSQRANEQLLSAAECLQIIKTEFGLVDFYRDQSKKSNDLDQASDDVYLDVIIAMAENFKTVMEFYQFICVSLDEDNAQPEDDPFGPKASADPDTNKVFMSTIHKTKGKEFKNVVLFNLSQAEGPLEQVEEERRVVYVAATRPKDDLLVTFSSAKPSPFIFELAQNPKYKTRNTDALKRAISLSRQRLEKEKLTLKRLETDKQKATTDFDTLTDTDPQRWQGFLGQIAWKLQGWRIDRTQEKIDLINRKINAHTEKVIQPLVDELGELDEETHVRNALNGSPAPPK